MKKILTVLLISVSVTFLLSGCRVTTIEQAIIAAESNGSIPRLNHDNTIAGPDKDNNGIRDDIDAYIATLPYTEIQKKAVQQDARALTATLTVDKMDKTAVIAANEKLTRSIGCLHFQFDSDTASKMFADNQKMTVNTKNRFLEYEKFNSALSGSTWTLPDRETSCDN
ncbi:MAG: hypothetical protein Q8R58_10255 [Sulfuricurvum sp.]|nr:hypothetical protein [Sulfuricurvum sp.]